MRESEIVLIRIDKVSQELTNLSCQALLRLFLFGGVSVFLHDAFDCVLRIESKPVEEILNILIRSVVEILKYIVNVLFGWL